MNAGFNSIAFLLPNYVESGSVQLGPMVYFLVTYAVASAGALTGVAFLAGRGDRNENLDDLRGRGRKRPFVALGVAVCLASLAGLPPVAGFLAKFTLFTGAFSAGLGWLAAVGFALSLVAAVYYLRIAFVLFMPAPETCECKCCCSSSAPFSYLLKFGVAVAAIALVVVSVVPGIALL
jgi:NADH-quinone oxidoreductase subunit N